TAGLPMPPSGKYIAWLSTSSNDMTCRMTGMGSPPVGCTLPGGGPTWTNTQGQPIANGFAQLFGGSLVGPVRLSEGKAVSGSSFAWTGTNYDGTVPGSGATQTCTDWALAGSGISGSIGSTGSIWSNANTSQSCSGASQPVYCFAM